MRRTEFISSLQLQVSTNAWKDFVRLRQLLWQRIALWSQMGETVAPKNADTFALQIQDLQKLVRCEDCSIMQYLQSLKMPSPDQEMVPDIQSPEDWLSACLG